MKQEIETRKKTLKTIIKYTLIVLGIIGGYVFLHFTVVFYLDTSVLIFVEAPISDIHKMGKNSFGTTVAECTFPTPYGDIFFTAFYPNRN